MNTTPSSAKATMIASRNNVHAINAAHRAYGHHHQRTMALAAAYMKSNAAMDAYKAWVVKNRNTPATTSTANTPNALPPRPSLNFSNWGFPTSTQLQSIPASPAQQEIASNQQALAPRPEQLDQLKPYPPPYPSYPYRYLTFQPTLPTPLPSSLLPTPTPSQTQTSLPPPQTLLPPAISSSAGPLPTLIQPIPRKPISFSFVPKSTPRSTMISNSTSTSTTNTTNTTTTLTPSYAPPPAVSTLLNTVAKSIAAQRAAGIEPPHKRPRTLHPGKRNRAIRDSLLVTLKRWRDGAGANGTGAAGAGAGAALDLSDARTVLRRTACRMYSRELETDAPLLLMKARTRKVSEGDKAQLSQSSKTREGDTDTEDLSAATSDEPTPVLVPGVDSFPSSLFDYGFTTTADGFFPSSSSSSSSEEWPLMRRKSVCWCPRKESWAGMGSAIMDLDDQLLGTQVGV